MRDSVTKERAVRQWQADERFEAFMREHRNALVRLAKLTTRDPSNAEDSVHDALIAVGAVWSKVNDDTALAYARTAVIRQARRNSRARPRLPAWFASDDAVDDVGFLRLEEDRELVRILRILPTNQRITLVLRYCFDMPDRAIAEVMGCTEGTVRSQAHRGLETLRNRLLLKEGQVDDRKAERR